MSTNIEYRLIPRAEMEADSENRQITGYGIVFNSDSHPLNIPDGRGTVRVVEQIRPESLVRTDMSDVISAYNHNFEKILGRTTSNTLKLTTDGRGVRYSVALGNQTYATDLLESVQRGDVAGSSFVFSYNLSEGWEFTEREDGTLVASPRKIEKVYEMGPVTNPAYPATTAENRSNALEEAVRSYLDAKGGKVEQRDDQGDESTQERTQSPDTPPTTTEAEVPEAEERSIEYPFPCGYYRTKAKAKKRV